MNRSKMPDSITTDSVIVPQMSRGRFLRSSAVLVIGLTVPPELYEATSIDGGGWWARFRHSRFPGCCRS